MNPVIFYIAAIIVACVCPQESNAPTNRVPWRPAPTEVVAPAGLPEIGKWMFDPEKRPAQWLGERYEGRTLREPINLVIEDRISKSADESRARLIRSLKEAGFPVREGHTAGYQGYIEGFLYGQIPEGRKVAFSDEPFELSNNHGRIFGPHPFQGGWIFIGAVSREKVDVLDKVKHRYVSFNRARDAFARSLDLKTSYKIASYLNLENAAIGDPAVSTGDHDAIAVLLRAVSSRPGG